MLPGGVMSRQNDVDDAMWDARFMPAAFADEHYPIIPTRERDKRPKWNKPKWARIAALVRERDHHQCQHCGAFASLVDHVLPLARGGINDPENFQVLCGRCNAAKGCRVEWA